MKKKIGEVMSKPVHIIYPQTTVQEAAQKMKELDVGVLPICDGEKILGTLTDRNIALRVVAPGLDARQTAAEKVMTSPPIYCFDYQDADEAARIMEVKQVRRLLVLDSNKHLVGITSLGDLAMKTGRDLAGEVLEKVSEPGAPTQDKQHKASA